VRFGARADADEVDVRVGEQLFGALVASNGGRIKCETALAGGFDVPAGVTELPATPMLFWIAHRDEPAIESVPCRGLIRCDVRRAHEAQADHADANR
jgi:hypothetical protein